jgi:hypothetical protein
MQSDPRQVVSSHPAVELHREELGVYRAPVRLGEDEIVVGVCGPQQEPLFGLAGPDGSERGDCGPVEFYCPGLP